MPDKNNSFILSLRRIGAVILRNLYILSSSWMRLVEIAYWPALNIIIWGFLNFYLSIQATGIGTIAGVLIGTTIFLEVYNRSYLGMLFPFLEEMWSRNIGQLFVSPIRPLEYLAGVISISFLRTILSMAPCVLIAWSLFDYWLFDLGLPIIAFYFVLSMTGWWCGCLILALLLRFGLAAESFAWMFGFTLVPLSAAYYPVSILPSWLQNISWVLPPTYAFEGLRALFNEHIFRSDLLWKGFVLNLVYLTLSGLVCLKSYNYTRSKGGLLTTLND